MKSILNANCLFNAGLWKAGYSGGGSVLNLLSFRLFGDCGQVESGEHGGVSSRLGQEVRGPSDELFGAVIEDSDSSSTLLSAENSFLRTAVKRLDIGVSTRAGVRRDMVE